MNRNDLHLGIDLGSISLKGVLVGAEGQVLFSRWMRVAGAPLECLTTLLGEMAALYPDARIASAGVTGSGKALIASLCGANAVNEITAHAAAAGALHPEVRSIIEIGGQDSKLIILDVSSHESRVTSYGISHFAMNELCAAGTGAFLDQQAARLGLKIEDFARLALDSESPAPIAGRCAVFAKTDMTHHQQEGRPLADIVAGLNEALVRSYLANLVRGKDLPRPIAFQGGVAANDGLVKAFRRVLGLKVDDLIVPGHHLVMGAIGAAIIASEKQEGGGCSLSVIKDLIAGRQAPRRAGACTAESSDGASARLVPPLSKPVDPDLSSLSLDGTYLGIDVGSVSVKLAAVGRSGIIFSDYRFSEGRPIDVLRLMIADIMRSHGDTEFAGVGVTGSGRQFIGRLVSADIIINEITAQAKAAGFILPGADTVIEIGGQDAKLIILDVSSHESRVTSHRISHFTMNRVCAAGTGAFLQDEAQRLKIDLERDFAREAFESVSPAALGARCTVFMESDLVAHQQGGYSRRDLAAGLAHAIIANYMEKVKGPSPVGNRILFLGGVAENRAVVAALESALAKPVATSTAGKISGAIGAALAAHEARRDGKYLKSAFSLDRTLAHEQFVCADCANSCRVTRTKESAPRTFGGRCGKWDSALPKRAFRHSSLLKKRMELLEQRRMMDEGRKDTTREVASIVPASETSGRPSSLVRIGIPRALLAFDMLPTWRTFFEGLGCEVVLSPPTDESILSEGMKHLVVETCLPVKAFCAHLTWLEKNGNVDFIFVPSIVATGGDLHGRETVHCPYIQALVQIAAPVVRTPLLNPVVNWRWNPRDEIIAMSALAVKLGRKISDGRRAWNAALDAQRVFREALRRMGDRVLADLGSGKIQRAFVILGKDYNVFDPALNSRAAKILEEMGEVVVTQEMIVADDGAYSPAYRTMYWSHGKEMIAAAEIAAKTPGLYPVMITSFGCGPDSFTIRFAKDAAGDKPFLLLEVDEHSSSVGMETRIEAFMGGLPAAPRASAKRPRAGFVPSRSIRRVFVPNFSDHGIAFAAAFRSLGFTPVLTGPPDDESARLGSVHASSGECHPFVLMLGDYIKVATSGEDLSDACYFMPEGGGCRVGQFGTQMRLVGDDLDAKLPVYTRVEDLALSVKKTGVGAYVKSVLAFWEMMRGCDFLMQKYFDTRARENTPGSADEAHAVGNKIFLDRIMAGRPREGLAAAIARLDSVPVDGKSPRVRIGITGDYYTRICDYANGDIFREIERLGGQVWLPPTVSESVKYDSRQRPRASLRHGRWTELLRSVIVRSVIERREERVRALFGDSISYEVPLDYERSMKLIEGYMNEKLPAGLTGSVAAILEQIAAGADGILNLITLHCTYGLVLSSVLCAIEKEYPAIPKLTLIFEGLKPTHNRTRLEAFMECVRARKTMTNDKILRLAAKSQIQMTKSK